MKIAIIGSGISGLASAYFLSKKYEVWLFEQENYLGGHSHTVEIDDSSGRHSIDTGFIVCNKKTYPNFMHLLNALNIELEASCMGFSVKDPLNNIEFAGQNLNTIFAQRKNLFKLNFWQMLFDITRFNRYAKQALVDSRTLTLGEFLDKHPICNYAKKYYILPLIAAIWSTSTTQALEFPAVFLFKFLDNHGLLSLNSAPQWYTIKGGSISYVTSLQQQINGNILLDSKVQKVTRLADKIQVKTENLEENFDKVVFAVHSDQVLEILNAPNNIELDIFNNIKYQDSDVTLHTDTSILPTERRAWASWNYFINNSKHPNLTYNMNILQNLKTHTTYCISLNLDEHLNKESIINKYKYAHPVYDQKSMHAIKLWERVNTQNIYYVGAYWGYGFHEDGINSAIRAVNAIDKDILCKTPYTQAL
jgi:uncharacterized protein